MRKFLAFALLVSIGTSCLRPTQQEAKRSFPDDFQKVLSSHGGFETWDKARTLSFTIDSTDHFTVDLKDRRELIQTPTYQMGFDGTDLWSKADTSFKSDPKFIKNLMFYFYAMPFVLADPGIKYDNLPSKTILGTSYEGVKISYEDSVGLSPKDEYYLYYEKGSGQMAWLAYTVTYFSGEKSDRMSWIKYDQWQEVESLLLPEKLIWHKSDENGPTEMRSSRVFTDVILSDVEKPNSFYGMVEGGTLAE